MINSQHRSFRAGDKGSFEFAIGFVDDPDQGRGATPDESASWGWFQIWVAGQNLCRHFDGVAVNEEIHWYLLPLLEWFVDNWDPIFHEERQPTQTRTPDGWTSYAKCAFAPETLPTEDVIRWEEDWYEWWKRHALHACSHGGLLPDLFIKRWQDLIEFSWGVSEQPGASPDFLFRHRHHYYRLQPSQAAAPLHQVLLAAIRYLNDENPQSEPIAALLHRAMKLSKTPREIRLAWLAGLGTRTQQIFSRFQRIHRVLQERFAEQATALFCVEESDLFIQGSCEGVLMYGSLNPTVEEEDLLVLADNLVQLSLDQLESEVLARLVQPAPLTGDQRAYDKGYELALEVLGDRGFPCYLSSDYVDIAAVVQNLGIKLADISLQDSRIRAVAVAGPTLRPAILLNKNSVYNLTDQGCRFTLAHELCHILFDRDHGRRLAMATGPWAPADIERRANAFAAMLLMPPDLIKQAINISDRSGQLLSSAEAVNTISRQLRTSFRATVEHLFNLGYLDETEKDLIMHEKESVPSQV